MATADSVYNATTTQEPKSKKWIIVPSENLDKVRFAVKVIEVVSSMFHVLSENSVSTLDANVTTCLHVYCDHNLYEISFKYSNIAIYALSFIVA